MKQTYTTTTIAWISSGGYRMGDFLSAVKKEDAADVIDSLYFCPRDSMGKGKDPWTRVGVAEITVTIDTENKVVENTVKALREKKKAVMAEAQMESTNIERQIQQLLAITNEVKA